MENADEQKLPYQTINYESILSLLVKILFKNRTECEDSQTLLGKQMNLSFLNGATSSDTRFDQNRVGDENDFIENLLEKAAKTCTKCRTNVEKSLETLNNLNRKHLLDESNSGVHFSELTGETSKLTPGTEDDLK